MIFGNKLKSKSKEFFPEPLRSRLFFFLYLTASAALLLYFYRRGGPVDDIYGPASKPGMRDVGIYIDAAHKIVQGVNPYSIQDLGFRSGTFGVLLFTLFDDNQISFVVLQGFNLLGVLLFTHSLLKDKVSSIQILVLSITSLWFSCFREILSTGQITGILMGLLGFGYTFMTARSKSMQILAALSFAIVLDLKPHVFFLFIISAYIYHKKFSWLWIVSFQLVLGHMLINIYIQTFTEDEWVKTLFAVSNVSNDPSSSGTRTVWPIVRNVMNLDAIPSFIPIIFFVCIGLLVLIKIYTVPNFYLLFASLLVPVTYSYFHLYSFLPIAILSLWALLRLQMPIFLGVIFSFLVISGGTVGTREALVSFVVFLVFLFQISQFFGVRNGFIQKFSKVLILILSIRFIVSSFIKDLQFREIVNINFLVVSAFVLILLGLKRENIIVNRNNS